MFELDFAALVDRGPTRELEEDAARVMPRVRMALVAEGVGGPTLGNLASRRVADAFARSFERLGGAGERTAQTMERLQSAFREANLEVAALSTMGEGGSKVIAAVFAHGRLLLGNVGDARCYRLRNGALEVMTEDPLQDAVPEAAARRAWESSEARAQWARMSTRYLDGSERLTVDLKVHRCETEDVYVLCSYGLWSGTSERLISSVLKSSQDSEEACERLIDAARAGGPEHVAVAVVRLAPMQRRVGEPFWLDMPCHAGDQPSGEF